MLPDEPKRERLPAQPPRVEVARQLEGFVPPPRFGTTSFDTYAPTHESQHAAVASVTTFVDAASRTQARRWPWQRGQQGAGLYLDGGFGVGKTHLLAAAWHASPLPPSKKRYMSFQELVYLLGVLGREGAQTAFEDVQLVCLDEFELDDPGNTLLIAMFLRQAFERDMRVITTSNTDPASQGRGRFAAADFQREIQGIASRFDVVAIDGADYRAGFRDASWSTEGEMREAEARVAGRVIHAPFAELVTTLEKLHPIHYRGLLEGVDLFLLDGVTTIPDQNTALRFVHFVDKMYDLGVPLRASGEVPLAEVFDAFYREGAYAKKHHRCTSRIREMLGEDVGARGVR